MNCEAGTGGSDVHGRCRFEGSRNKNFPTHPFGQRTFDEFGRLLRQARRMAEFAVIAVPPREHAPVGSESERVAV